MSRVTHRYAIEAGDALIAPAHHASDENGGWLMSYLDMLTLLITLFVLLLALTGNDDSNANDTTLAMPVLGVPTLHAPAWTPNFYVPPRADKRYVPPRETAFYTPPPMAPLTPRMIMVNPAPAEALMARVESSPTSAVRRLTETLKPLIDGVVVTQSAQTLNFRIENRLLFSSSNAGLTDAGRDVLRQLLDSLREFEGEITVEGHTDSRPIATDRFPSNWELSTARAAAVLRFLVEEGIDRDKLRAVGYADTHPLKSNATAEGRAANRRVELVLHEPDPPTQAKKR
ncbi:chemotaxis protein MotB [Chromohalobacter marismortui]|uniref:Chemotaxis protein MotB n=1 Tax=Chromohalobacter marismortui TaxID=42055 RepID=A0A4R7NUX5_9GAMM|nr:MULTISPECIES: OmpA family protein [Chromohalobacter]MCI0510479.1 OmpA family protein [Chromohalobacter sp.]MCI0594168.1 OmpA family protein [Chromohalobacter sp.]TDU24945.1 chemotaxis protein MotB [Chromohalobacter marismortui]